MYRSRFLGSPKNLDVLYTGTIYLLTLYNILKTIHDNFFNNNNHVLV